MDYRSLYYGLSRLEEPIKAMVEKAVGPQHAAQMYQSRALAESYLTHTEPKFRLAAINVLAVHWGPDEVFKAACERLILDDRDTDVRCWSVIYLCICDGGSDDARVGRIVAQLVYDNAEPHELRIAAYRSLFCLRTSHGNTPRPTKLPAFHFPEDVDWRFVDSFLYRDARCGKERGKGDKVRPDKPD